MSRPLILAVDDQANNLEAVAALLEMAEYDVATALSGREALEACAQRPPDLVLLDMRMPGMDGIAVCTKLRQDPRTTHIPVIFLTAAHQRETVVEAFSTGAVDYVTKPFVAEELLARVKTHVELKRARDHLAAIAQERADLTQIVAHDLKNPLTSILLAVERIASPGESIDAAAVIRRSAERCLAFIDRYLGRWAASTTQARALDVVPLNLGPILREAAEGLAHIAQDRGMRIHVQVDSDPLVLGSPTAVRHVVDNLISNALRYAPRGSAVEVRCETGLGRVSVEDRGPGVPAERQGQLFKRYVRMENSADTPHSTGLGLAISREEVERMSGRLWYRDREGGGASFCFVLPLVEETAPVTEA
ncbi:MAG TPA: hybrid sensor histidine kinase/response regulator [Solimonas sp.]|nr:hybrid sensor histidine kinase/response regulator [Solimonas sp.]